MSNGDPIDFTKLIWQAKLARDFPDRTFAVSFPKGPFEDLSEYEVTFWQG